MMYAQLRCGIGSVQIGLGIVLPILGNHIWDPASILKSLPRMIYPIALAAPQPIRNLQVEPSH